MRDNNLKAKGAQHLAEALKVNTALTAVECVAPYPHLPNLANCQQPLTPPPPRTRALPCCCLRSVDGHPLEINQLKGTEPVESIDLSNKSLGVASAIVIASLMGSNTVTKSLKCAAAPDLYPDCTQCQDPLHTCRLM